MAAQLCSAEIRQRCAATEQSLQQQAPPPDTKVAYARHVKYRVLTVLTFDEQDVQCTVHMCIHTKSVLQLSIQVTTKVKSYVEEDQVEGVHQKGTQKDQREAVVVLISEYDISNIICCMHISHPVSVVTSEL
eukprot:13965-Heterococcus_DN1.PRE.2